MSWGWEEKKEGLYPWQVSGTRYVLRMSMQCAFPNWMTYTNRSITAVFQPAAHSWLQSWNHFRRKAKREEAKYMRVGVAVRGWMSMKIYMLKNSCKMFNVSMNVLCLQ